MRTRLLVIGLFVSIAINLNGQDTTKIRVDFHTKSNYSMPLYRQVYVGNVNTSGWVGQHYSWQEGIITKNEFLFNAPNTGYFKKDEPVVLIMPGNFSFVVNPMDGNQKWMLIPAGTDYLKSRKHFQVGKIGIFISSFLLASVIIDNIAQNSMYNANMRGYNLVKQGSPPQAPHMGILYLIPAITYSISIPIYFSGKHLYDKNRPNAVRIE